MSSCRATNAKARALVSSAMVYCGSTPQRVFTWLGLTRRVGAGQGGAMLGKVRQGLW